MGEWGLETGDKKNRDEGEVRVFCSDFLFLLEFQ